MTKMMNLKMIQVGNEPYVAIKFYYPFSDYKHHNMVEELQISPLSQNMHDDFLISHVEEYLEKLIEIHDEYESGEED